MASKDEKNMTKKQRQQKRKEEKKKQQELEERREKLRSTIYWGVGVVIVGLLLYAIFNNTNSSTQTTTSEGDLAVAVNENDHRKGNLESDVELVEYGDFQCPACEAYESILKEVEAEFGGDIQFVYRHFPLTRIHQYAQITAQASEAAALQGKFWEMHDRMFERQDEWSSLDSEDDVIAKLREYAEDLGMDGEQFASDINSDAVKEAVQDDVLGGRQADLNSTPSFFLNGRRLTENPQSADEFKQIVGEELAKAGRDDETENMEIDNDGDDQMEQASESQEVAPEESTEAAE